MTHASVIPLIGGSTIASIDVFKSDPEWIASYPGFEKHDGLLLEYLEDRVDYLELEKDELSSVDVISTICPCAGLSTMSGSKIEAANPNNDWMIKTAEYVTSVLKPEVFWGENAVQLVTQSGSEVLDTLHDIAERNGYSLSVYKTSSIYHGLPQNRRRAFYFFWKGDEAGVIPWSRKKHGDARDIIRSAPASTNFITKGKPSDSVSYGYLLDVVCKGISHKEFAASLDRTIVTLAYLINDLGVDLNHVAEYAEKQGDRFSKTTPELCRRSAAKIEAGGGIRYNCPRIPHAVTNAMVGANLGYLAHPDEDRYVTTAEGAALMGLPSQFDIERKHSNKIAQNVPVPVAKHMARAVKKFVDRKLETIDTEGGIFYQDNFHKTQTLRENARR